MQAQAYNPILTFKPKNSASDSILPVPRSQSIRSIDKVDGANFAAFEYEFKRKPYASFNNYSVIPPIQNKNKHSQEAPKLENHSEQMLLNSEINSHSQKHLRLAKRNNGTNSVN